MPNRILTLHPDNRKRGINIEKEKYNLIKESIIEHLSKKKEMKFMELTQVIEQELKDNFTGSISWYVTTIKLDLEARNEIERIPDKQPQFLRLPQRHIN